MDPRFIKPDVTAQCAEVAHRCSGIFCGCECHGADRAQARALLDAARGSIEIKLPDLSRVALEPGDTLVVRTQQPVSLDGAVKIRQTLQQHFPGHDVVVLGNGAELVVVRPVPAPEDSRPLRHVMAGMDMPDSHLPVMEAYWREFGRPPLGSFITAAMVNVAVDWWNARDDDSTVLEAPKED